MKKLTKKEIARNGQRLDEAVKLLIHISVTGDHDIAERLTLTFADQLLRQIREGYDVRKLLGIKARRGAPPGDEARSLHIAAHRWMLINTHPKRKAAAVDAHLALYWDITPSAVRKHWRLHKGVVEIEYYPGVPRLEFLDDLRRTYPSERDCELPDF